MAGRSTSSNAFAQGSNQNCGNQITDRSTTRIHAPPGGQSSICLGGYPEETAKQGVNVSSNRFATGSNQNCGNQITERSSTGLHAPPGGKSSICIGMTGPELPDPKAVSSNRYATGSDQNCGNVISERSSTRLHAPPGGQSSLCIGAGGMTGPEEPNRVSSNRFANGSNQNSGNILSERSSTGLHAPPGGKSSICLGMDASDAPVSSNRFATGSNQNCGNVISERSSTGLHAPPGGKSSICIGSDLPETVKPRNAGSANKFANGSNQNSGNFMTDRPTTGVLAPPGGKSSICLGMDEPTPARAQGRRNERTERPF